MLCCWLAFSAGCWRLGAALPDRHANCVEGSIRDYRTQFDRVPGQAEQLRLDNGDLFAGTQVRFTDADDQGQWGARLSYYIDTFYIIPPMGAMMDGMMENGFSLPGIEFNFSYQNVHSRVPYVRYGNGGRPVVTKAIIGASSTTGGIALQALGCGAGGSIPDALIGALNAGGANIPTGSYLTSGRFRDVTIKATQNTQSTVVAPGAGDLNPDPTIGRLAQINALRAGLQNPDILRLALDPQHFSQRPGEDSSADRSVGLADLLRYGAAADAILGAVWAGTPLADLHNADTIVSSLTANGANRYDVARIICAQAVTQTDTSFAALGAPPFAGTPLAPLAGFAGLPVVGSEFLAVQYIPSVELYYPENISVIGGSFNTTIPWVEWGIQGEISYRPNMPLQVDVTSQIVATAVAQGVGVASQSDASRFTLGPLVTLTSSHDRAPEDAARSFAEFQGYVDNIEASIAGLEALGVGATPEQIAQLGGLRGALVGAVIARDTFATPLIPAIYERYIAGEFHGRLSEFEADMLNYTIGTTALYNNSNPVVNFLGADQAIFLMEFNAIQFIDTLPGGWDPNGAHASGVALADKNFTLHCIARAGSELPLGGVVGLDSLDNKECSPDDTSMGYTLFGFLDYNNVFSTAWRLRPSMALRHGVKGNTPSPVPGWREDTLSVTWGLEANFQNSWRARMSYVAFFDVGSNDYNSNSGNDSWSFNISYAF